ncbi:MAG TPA: S9 family peptidase [Sphingomicrobium sp.]|nr:S9 family peptidase [Sphingomicrobium sp.]
MTKFSLLLAAAAAALVASPLAARPMTATDLQSMHRLGSPAVSPDGRWAVFTVSTTEWDKNRRVNTLHRLDLVRGGPPQAIRGAERGHHAMFTADGSLWFLMPVGEQDQLFRMAPGGAPVQVSNFTGEVGGFKVSRTGNSVVVWADRDMRCGDLTCAGLPAPPQRGSGQAFDELFVRHWDTWAKPGVRSRLFGFAVSGGRLAGRGVPLSGALVGDTPSKPFGGGEEIAFSPDGRTVYFALREGGRSEPWSTNLDIFAVPVDGSAAPANLTAANRATDNLPVVSPDGRTLAYVAMARPGYESDRQVLMLRDLASGQVRPLTQGFDRSVDSIEWAPDGRSLLITAADSLEKPVFRVDAATGRVTRLTSDGQAGNVHALPDGSVLLTLNSVYAPDDLFRLDPRGRLIKLTALNDALLGQLDPINFRKFTFPGAGGARVSGISVKPALASGPLPVHFIVHGGPQGSFGNSWSYRWNPRLFASPGYGVVSIDFHGSTGHGQAFTDSINRDWGGKPLEDLKRGLAHALASDRQLDGNRVCASGASYGGYMMYWIAGNWPDRFRCIVSHNGVFDTRSMGFMTEELWFTEWEFGGTPWEAPREYERWNPILHVDKWRTPTLVIISDRDYRVPYTQGLGAFTALQRRGVPSRLLRFPDENHWVLKPKNSVQWYDEVVGWLGRHLKQ